MLSSSHVSLNLFTLTPVTYTCHVQQLHCSGLSISYLSETENLTIRQPEMEFYAHVIFLRRPVLLQLPQGPLTSLLTRIQTPFGPLLGLLLGWPRPWLPC